MSKPIKGVMPAAPKKHVNETKPVESNPTSLKPIKKAKPGTKIINTKDVPEAKVVKVPNEDELAIITDAIVERLMGVFVPRAEVKEVVEKTLQEMVASGANVSKK